MAGRRLRLWTYLSQSVSEAPPDTRCRASLTLGGGRETSSQSDPDAHNPRLSRSATMSVPNFLSVSPDLLNELDTPLWEPMTYLANEPTHFLNCTRQLRAWVKGVNERS